MSFLIGFTIYQLQANTPSARRWCHNSRKLGFVFYSTGKQKCRF